MLTRFFFTLGAVTHSATFASANLFSPINFPHSALFPDTERRKKRKEGKLEKLGNTVSKTTTLVFPLSLFPFFSILQGTHTKQRVSQSTIDKLLKY